MSSVSQRRKRGRSRSSSPQDRFPLFSPSSATQQSTPGVSIGKRRRQSRSPASTFVASKNSLSRQLRAATHKESLRSAIVAFQPNQAEEARQTNSLAGLAAIASIGTLFHVLNGAEFGTQRLKKSKVTTPRVLTTVADNASSGVRRTRVGDALARASTSANFIDLSILYDIDTTPLGAGAFGTVYRATLPGTTSVFALKLLHDVNDESRREVELLRKFTATGGSPNVVKYHKQFTALYDGHIFHVLEMEFVRGQGMKHFFHSYPIQPSPTTMCHLLTGALNALVAIHSQGILHLDIKPANIMIRKPGNDFVLVDFGIACDKNASISEIAVTGCAQQSANGTRQFFSPERLLKCMSQLAKTCTNEILEGADIWALGMSFFALLNESDYRNLIARFEPLLVQKRYADAALVLNKDDWAKAGSVYIQDQAIERVIRQMLLRNARRRPSAAQLLQELTLACAPYRP